jgi:hypothetical protein
MPRSVIDQAAGVHVYEPGDAINGAARCLSPSVNPPETAFLSANPVDLVGWLARGSSSPPPAPGTGKTTMEYRIAAKIVCTGGRWPDGSVVEQGDVLI